MPYVAAPGAAGFAPASPTRRRRSRRSSTCRLAGTERPVLTADMRAFEHTVNADILAHYPDKRSLEVLLASQLGVAPEQALGERRCR